LLSGTLAKGNVSPEQPPVHSRATTKVTSGIVVAVVTNRPGSPLAT
jgi:hypothetical protein